MILYPNIEICNLLNNKLDFVQFMLENFKDNIPTVYYLKNTKLQKIITIKSSESTKLIIELINSCYH
jgi:hypothetical protein